MSLPSDPPDNGILVFLCHGTVVRLFYEFIIKSAVDCISLGHGVLDGVDDQ